MATIQMVRMIVTKAHRYGCKHVEVGEQIEATPKVAKLAQKLKFAALVPADQLDGELPSQNTYETRVITAAGSNKTTPPAAAARRYVRRGPVAPE